MKAPSFLPRTAAVLAALAAGCSSLPTDAAPEPAAPARISPFLLFQDGRAEEAMEFYVSLFDGGRVLRADRYGPGEAGAEGSIQLGIFEVAGQRVMCTESTAPHEFDFTPSLSLFVDCRDDAEIERLAGRLEEGGAALMPLGSYGFSERFAWIQDRYGVSWQLNLHMHED